jgi:hypothetical protein
MVDLEEYRLDFYTGMVASMGGIAETLVIFCFTVYFRLKMPVVVY